MRIIQNASYAGLDTGTSGDAGGDTIPTGFQAELPQAMKQYDGLFDAARWLFTRSGSVLNFPISDDSSSSGDASVLTKSQAIARDE